jgi:hypothetical protein
VEKPKMLKENQQKRPSLQLIRRMLEKTKTRSQPKRRSENVSPRKYRVHLVNQTIGYGYCIGDSMDYKEPKHMCFGSL